MLEPKSVIPMPLALHGTQAYTCTRKIPVSAQTSSCLFLPLLSPKSIYSAWARASSEKGNVAASLLAYNLARRLPRLKSEQCWLSHLLPPLRTFTIHLHSYEFHASCLFGCPATSSAQSALLCLPRSICDIISSLKPSLLAILL